jgi:hypothetical protein
MPSLEAVEQFKSIVTNLANEPQIRAKMGLPAEEITPPEAGMSQDLASLIGGMPTATAEADTAQGQGVELESDEASEETGSELEDVFGSEVTPEDSDAGPSMDDLLGPVQPEETSFEDPFATPLLTVDDAAQDLGLGGIDDALGVEEEAFGSTADQSFGAPPEVSDFGNDIAEPGEDLPALDDFGGFETPEVPDLGATEDAFGPPPVANTSDPSGVSADEEFEFAADGEAGDFPELAGFANTKEEDVEAFDALGVADEFGLGDFESQFGITADDQADPELLNPAQSIDAEIEAAVRAELPWLLERRQAGERAAAEDTVSGRLRQAVKDMRQPYEQVCQATGIPFEQLADFMAGGQLASDALDRLATAAHCELVPRGTEL